MTIDNLTISGVLFTLPYIAMLVMFCKNRRTSKQDEMLLFEYLDDEPYRYGT